MTPVELLGLIGLGFISGARHALDGDHIAAMSAMVTKRGTVSAAARLGVLWGVGHSFTLLGAGTAVLLLNLTMPESFTPMLEGAVGIMLIILGASAIQRLRGSRLHFHWHCHGARPHLHLHSHAAGPAHDHLHPARPLAVGMIHGLAGTGGLVLVVLATVRSALVGILYLVFFGLGSVAGMFLFTTAIGLPLSLTSQKYRRSQFWMRAGGGAVCLGTGLWILGQAARGGLLAFLL